MYRIGSTKFAVAALLPINTLLLAKSGKTLSVLRIVMVTFQGLMTLWLVAMAGLAVAALSMHRRADLRTPRVADPRTPRSLERAEDMARSVERAEHMARSVERAEATEQRDAPIDGPGLA